MTTAAPDPFAVLGLAVGASVAEIRSARRRLALDLHPDLGGSDEAMKALNAAFEAAIAHATGRRPLRSSVSKPDVRSTTERDETYGSRATRSSRQDEPSGSRPWGRFAQDHPSFVVDALPAEAFEALLIVTSWIGEVLVDEPPYLLEVHLYEPSEACCRLDLVPDAGSSTVSITVGAVDGGRPPDVEVIRDVWVAHLNQLGRWQEP